MPSQASSTVEIDLSDAPSTLGKRVRALRELRGMTQSELAARRCSNEYVSQIERGRTRPTAATVGWLAAQLGTDTDYLRDGVRACDTAALAVIESAEAQIREQEWDLAVATITALPTTLRPPGLALRACWAESWARMYLGQVREALKLLEAAIDPASAAEFTAEENVETLYRLGCCHYKLSAVNRAIDLFTEAVDLLSRSDAQCDRLLADTLQWRSRCWRRFRDFEAAREDIEKALELYAGLGDMLNTAHASFQASIVAERTGQWKQARALAVAAIKIFEEHGDELSVARLTNNVGGLTFLLGQPEMAIEHLKRAFAIALDLGQDADAGQAESSLAQVHLAQGQIEAAERQARHALKLLSGREDFLDEIANAQMVLGRALIRRGRLQEAEKTLRSAQENTARLLSPSHHALALTAHGELETARGQIGAAAKRYRDAAAILVASSPTEDIATWS